MKYLKLIGVFTFLLSFSLKGATVTSTATGGNWSTATTWVGNKLPKAGDDIVINGVVTIVSDVTCKTLKINTSKTLGFGAGGYSLTLTGTWTTVFDNNGGNFNAGDGKVIFKTNQSSGQTVAGTVTFNDVEVEKVSQMNFGTSSTINGKLLLTNGSQIVTTAHPTYGSNSTLEISGNYTISTNYYLWGNTLAKTPANLIIASGTVSAQQAVAIKKSLTVLQGATLNLSTSCVSLKASTFEQITNSGTLNLGGVIVESGLTWNLASDVTLSNLTIQNDAVVNAGSRTINFIYNTTGHCGATGRIINLVGTGLFNAGTGTVVINASANGNATFAGNVTLNNVVVTGGVVATNGNNATITINGNLTLNTGTNIDYGNPIPSGAITFGTSASITNNGGSTTNITSSVPSAPQPTAVDLALTTLSSSTSGGGNFNSGLRLTAPNSYQLGSNMTIKGSRKVLFIYAPAEFNTNGYSISADSVYVYGKLVVSNPSGLDAFLGTTKIYIDSAAIVEYNANATQIIKPGKYGTMKLTGAGNKVFSAGTFVVTKDLELDSGTVDFSNNPVFSITGHGQQEIAGLPFKNITFGGNGNKRLKDTTKVSGKVTIAESANLVSNGLLTLVSDASGTASIGTIPNTASVIGNVNYERYIPAGRLWRFIGWPISGSTVANSWQTTIHVTGPGTGGSLGGFNSNGFDWTAASAPSIYTYNESLNADINGKWQAIPNTNVSIGSTTGYRLFIRGPREAGTSLLTSSNHQLLPVVLKGTGSINTGDITVNLTSSNGGGNNNGWHLLANPYPSAIDWNNPAWVSERAALNSTIYKYNPAQNKYGAWNPIAGGVNGGSNEIASGQAFFVKTDVNTSLTFRESYKIDNSNSGLFGKTGATGLINNLKISIGETSKIYDETVVCLSAYATKAVDNEYDAIKPDVTNASISTYTNVDPTKLLINIVPNSIPDTIKLHTPLANANYNYLLRFTGKETFNDSVRLMLFDHYTLNQFVIDSANSVYAFSTVLNNAASRMADRFSLIIG
ncbi:MAG: beta strand repeat-containing protein, partial [Bacteroidia bacterium]